MKDRELAFAPAHRLAELIARKETSPVEVTELFIRRIEGLDADLNAYLTVAADEALGFAKLAEQAVVDGEPLGPLHGVPISIKDLEVTAGIRTTFGSLIYRDYVPDSDSGIVRRIRSSGAVIMGKTNTPEFGMSGTTENRLGDACRNPWDTSRTTGGSSGGSAAAVAAGLCPQATGSDAGGSIRIPASFCGVYGIKPTLGRVPRFGGVARPSPNPVSQPGPITRTVRDAAMMLQLLSGPDENDVITIREEPPDLLAGLDDGVHGLRIAWSPDLGFAAVDGEVSRVSSEAAGLFEELGAEVEETDIRLDDPFNQLNAIPLANGYASYGHLHEERPSDLSGLVRRRLELGNRVTGAEYAQALRYLEQMRRQVELLMERYDLLATPAMAVPAFPVGERPSNIAGQEVEADWAFNPFNQVFNMTQQPAASIPCGFTAGGLPVGLQLVGRLGEEATVLRASAAFERLCPWADALPPVS